MVYIPHRSLLEALYTLTSPPLVSFEGLDGFMWLCGGLAGLYLEGLRGFLPFRV